MCLLTYFPEGVMPDAEALSYGAVFNDDGHGFAIVSGNEIIVEKSLSSEDLIEAFVVERHRHPDGPALFHSRMSTHGNNSTENCHPFAVGGDKRTVIGHNGIMPKAVHPAKHDPRSDTRITAEDFIPNQKGHLRARRTRLALERWMGKWNKIVILTVDRSFREQSYILNEKMGTWDGGIWYSNDGYLKPTYTPRYRSLTGEPLSANRFWWEDEETGTKSTINSWTHCMDCLERYEDCQCYWARDEALKRVERLTTTLG